MAKRKYDIINDESDDIFTVPKHDAPMLSKIEIEDLKNKFRLGNKFPLETAETRNILIIGKSRSGKSTAIDVLKDPCFQASGMNIFSNPTDPKFQSFALDDKINKIKYTLNVIDTPGLQEVQKIGAIARNDQAILETVNYCLKNEITYINVLVLFMSMETGVFQNDVQTFEMYLEKFKHDNLKIIVCISRCESKTDKMKLDYIDQLKEHNYFSNLLNNKNVHITFCGCVDEAKINSSTNILDIQHAYARVYQMRTELLKHFFDAITKIKLIELPVTQKLKNDVLSIISNVLNCVNDLLTSDLTISSSQIKLHSLRSMFEILSHHDGLVLDVDILNQFRIMREKCMELKSIINENQKDIFDFFG